MSNVDVRFTQSMLRCLQDDFRQAGVMIDGAHPNLWTGHRAWTIRTDRQCWEFHGPGNFYWYGRADNAYDARYKGWVAWAHKHSPEWRKFEQQQEQSSGTHS